MIALAGYDIHGVHLVAEAAHAAAIDALDRRLGTFRSEIRTCPSVRLHLGVEKLASPSGDSRPIYDAPGSQVAYFEDVDELYVEYLGVRLRCAPAAGLIRLSWPRGDVGDIWQATHPLLTIALIEVLKRRGLYSLHAACAATAGVGVLVAGASGAGKSTLALALTQAGWEFLSDDLVFLATETPDVTILGFPDEIDVTESTLAMFPELVSSVRAPEVAGRGKASLRLEEALGLSPRLRCPPAVLVLASVAHSPHSTLVPVGAAEALVELVPNVLLTQAISTQAHLNVIGHLVNRTPCYRLKTGRDLGEACRLLALAVAEATLPV